MALSLSTDSNFFCDMALSLSQLVLVVELGLMKMMVLLLIGLTGMVIGFVNDD